MEGIDKNGRKHCYLCGHFMKTWYDAESSCNSCRSKHDDATMDIVMVCKCGQMFQNYTYSPQGSLPGGRKIFPNSMWREHAQMCDFPRNGDWTQVKLDKISMGERLVGSCIVENHFDQL